MDVYIAVPSKYSNLNELFSWHIFQTNIIFFLINWMLIIFLIKRSYEVLKYSARVFRVMGGKWIVDVTKNNIKK